jgi:fucose permease
MAQISKAGSAAEVVLILIWTALIGHFYFSLMFGYFKHEKTKDLPEIVAGTTFVCVIWWIGAAIITWVCGWFS